MSLRHLSICAVLLASPLLAVPPDAQTKPDDARATDAGKAIAGFKHPAGTTVSLFAAEPLLAGPVAFDVDVDGKVYVAETDRFEKGVGDNRAHGYWLLDDLAANTLAERQAYYDKWVAAGKKKPEWFTSHADQVRVLVDADGDGRADTSHVLAKFNDPLDGIGSGILADRGTIYYTNIPHLWKLRDADGDGTAEVREKLSTGYGVRSALLGHDLHGLAWGPDGKLYFSVGDRGFNITLPDGRVLRDPMDVGRGAVFRCKPDGSELEVYAWGLRNPQELAFDDYGNLWTGDNNSDAGDQARLVYVVEQGDSGWAMSFQTLGGDNSRGPWNQEKLWHTRHENQPAWIIPPVAHVTSGPSGFVHYPGLGLGDRYKGHFFLCDFRGGAGNSGVVSFTVTPDGAGFTMSKPEQFLWNVLATDVGFGYDGRMYLSDWVNGWNPVGQGRMYTLQDDEAIKNPRIAELTKLMREGFDKRPIEELVELLGHADQRVRLAAQFELTHRKAGNVLVLVAANRDEPQLKRIHAIWAIGQIKDIGYGPLIQLLRDDDAEIVAQSLRVLADLGATCGDAINYLTHANARVRYFAAMAIGGCARHFEANSRRPYVTKLVALLRDNDDRDVYLRHAAVVALWRIGDAEAVLAHADDSSKAVRLGVLLTLRRMHDPRIARYLHDTERSLVIEAARAIYDLSIGGATGQLADMLGGDLGPLNDDRQTTFALHRRVINAAYRRGTADDAARLAAYAADAKNPKLMRREALEALSDFAAPPPRERVLGFHRPLPPRDASLVAAALQPSLADLLKTDLNAEATALASKYHVTLDPAALAANVTDDKAASALRIASLEALADTKAPQLNASIMAALKSGDLHLRCAARDVLARFDANRAIAELDRVLASGHPAEKQRALATLAAMSDEKADALIVRSVEGVLDGSLVAEARLDAIEAARDRADASAPVKAALSRYDATTNPADPMTTLAIAKVGGDAARGRQVYLSHAAAQCQRCHTIGGVGGNAGPDLSHIASTRDRDYLLRSLVNPQAEIAEGFGTIALTLKDGSTVAGVIRSDADGKLTLLTPDGKTAQVNAADVTARSDPISAMPPMGFILKPGEVRDVIEYLSTLK